MLASSFPPEKRDYSQLDALPFVDPDKLRELARLSANYDWLCREGRQQFKRLCTEGFLETLLLQLADELEEKSNA